MLVWLQHEKDCFDNPTTYLPYMEGKTDSKLCCKHSAIGNCQHDSRAIIYDMNYTLYRRSMDTTRKGFFTKKMRKALVIGDEPSQKHIALAQKKNRFSVSYNIGSTKSS